MKRFTLALLALSLVGSTTELAAQQPAPSRPANGQAAQAPTGEIRGTVLDAESNAPISSASVSVYSKPDNTLVAGAIVRQDGSFRIEGLRPGTYTVRFTMIGYGIQNTPDLNLTAAAPRANLGPVKLARQAVEVAGVEATADRQVVIAPDRNAYRVKDIAPAAANASEVLDNVPSVSVDADGKVSLRGNENVVVQINGRPTPITGSQLAAYLRTMPSATIERVEVVPNPSAKQDPEGMAGIINIVMKQGVDLGRSGSLSMLAATNERYFVSGNLGYQAGKVALMFTYGFNKADNEYIGINNRTRLGGGVARSFTLQDLDGVDGFQGHNLSANLDYSFTRQNVLSTTIQLNRRSQDNLTFSEYTEQNATGQTVSTYDRLRDTEADSWLADVNLAFKRTITPQKHEWSVEGRFNHNDDDDFSALWRQAAGSAASQTEVEHNTIDAGTRNFTGQFDYTKMTSDKTKLEAGYKGQMRLIDRDYTALKDEDGNGTFVRTSSSNALDFEETINSAYAVLSHAASKKVDLQLGVRGEYAKRAVTLANGDYPYDYTSLYPSGIVTYKTNDKTQLKASYSRRVRRPGTMELNPFPQWFDQQNVFFGNPNLNPEYTNSFELGFQRSGALGTLQINPFYRATSDIIRFTVNTADTLDGREVTSISFKNLESGNSWGADVTGQWRTSPKLNGIVAFNVHKMVTDGGSTSALASDAVMWRTRANITWVAGKTTTLLANGFYQGKQEFEDAKFSSFKQVSFAVRQKLQGDKLVGTLRFNDPFKWAKFQAEVGDDNVIQLTSREPNLRGLFLNLQYTFGQTPRLRQRRQDDQPQSTNPFGN